MKTRDILIIGSLGVGAYMLLSKPKDSVIDSLLNGGASSSAPTAFSAQSLPGIGASVGASLLPGVLDWNPLTNPVGYAANVVGAISNAVSGAMPQKASFEKSNPTMDYINEYVAGALNVQGAYQTQGRVLKPTASFESNVGTVNAQKIAEVAGLNTGRGLASMKTGGVLLAKTQIYQPATITASGNVSSNTPLSSSQIASNIARGIW